MYLRLVILRTLITFTIVILVYELSINIGVEQHARSRPLIVSYQVATRAGGSCNLQGQP